ncbi:MAG: glucose-1-phosphate adenylyltransferase subunit GlgD [Butyrivibrio sp.]|nr:glucose-1-phosphate adenylyltransferase subunit GlgD [Butyrivibrio sp.]
MARAFGIVAPAGGYIRVEGLQDFRPINAFSFLGRYRIIDFPLSSFSNSEIERVQVYATNQNPRSLAEHIGSGRIYNINSKRGLLQMMFSREDILNQVYNTDVKAYLDNISIIERMHQPYVIITPGYMVFKEDYSKLLDEHLSSGADVTLLYHKVDNASSCYRNCFAVNLNRQKGIKSIEINTGCNADKNIFMDTYVMSKDLFIQLLYDAKATSSIYRMVDIVNSKCDELDVRGIQHKGYFAAITDFKSYYDANMELLNYDISSELFSDEWPIYTRTTDSCPVRYVNGSSVKNSMVANGCLIEGTVENSVIGRGVEIRKGAVVRNCVIMGHSIIDSKVIVENQVVDKWAKVTNIKQLIAPSDKPGYIKRLDVI